MIDYLVVFFVSMVPLIELRGAIPISQIRHLPIVPSYRDHRQYAAGSDHLSVCPQSARMGRG